ncbi:hypothetical protein D1872_51850 [compost metagenome]
MSSFASKGDHIYYLGKPTEVLQVSYMDPNNLGVTLPLAEGGILCYKLEGHGWVEAFSLDSETSRLPTKKSLEVLGYNMTKWKLGLTPQPDNEKLPSILTLLLAVQYDKERFYGSSWKGKGEYRGIMANIDRKYDRLDTMTQAEIKDPSISLEALEKALEAGEIDGDYVGESKVDAVADLANYALLYLTYIKDNYPRVFEVWVNKNVPEYLRDKIPFV